MFIVQSGELVVSKLADSGHVIRMANLGPGDFFGEMTLIEMQNRSATVVAEGPTVLYELTARKLYTCYKTDIHALCDGDAEYQPRALSAAPPRRQSNCRVADASRGSMTQISVHCAVKRHITVRVIPAGEKPDPDRAGTSLPGSPRCRVDQWVHP